jgi:predicted amidohydrolase
MKIALAQIISSPDPADNLARIARFAEDAARQGAELVVFPEAAQRAFGNPLPEIAEPLDGPWASGVRGIADRLGVVIVAGMFTPGADGRVRNTLLVARPAGALAAGASSYDKIHLFDAFGFRESDAVDPGEDVAVIEVGGTRASLATCYDVRFPALFLAGADRGAAVSVVCASWGAGPGKADQWDLLLRARALDSTTFVVAVGQGDPETLPAGSRGHDPASGAPTGIGRSAVVSPLGEVLHRLGGEEELLVVDLDPSAVEAARGTLPVLANRRRGLEQQA